MIENWRKNANQKNEEEENKPLNIRKLYRLWFSKYFLIKTDSIIKRWPVIFTRFYFMKFYNNSYKTYTLNKKYEKTDHANQS